MKEYLVNVKFKSLDCDFFEKRSYNFRFSDSIPENGCQACLHSGTKVGSHNLCLLQKTHKAFPIAAAKAFI